jgi:hypothetical protein
MFDHVVTAAILLFVLQLVVNIVHIADAHPAQDASTIVVCPQVFAQDFAIQNNCRIYNQNPLIFVTLRGGQADEYDDDDCEDDDSGRDDDGESYDDVPSRRSYDHTMIDPPHSPPTRKASQGRRPPLPRTSRTTAKKPAHWTQRMAMTGFKTTRQLAWGAVQQTGNLAYNIVKPRHIELHELRGMWRLDQSIAMTTTGEGDLASVATVELDPRERVVRLKLPDGTMVVEPFTFEKTRLGSWKTEFVCPAFLVGDTPRLYGYRGTWQRKLADKRVIKLVGKIYTVRKQRFGKDKGKFLYAQPVGTFVARRRMKLSGDDDDDDEQSEADQDYEGQDDEDKDESSFERDASDAYDD